ncbi:MAG: hypothetical protein JXB88_05095 [Spirochaetales bacterium]|nr:hypothetical protein [Spirochaetales bacterium]
MAFKKLSAQEISEVIAKIRSKYDFYCKTFYKPSRLKQEFENRYRDALKQGFDVSNFLLAEISVIEELVKKEEDKIAQSKPVQEKPKEDFADRIILENLKKIEKYPTVHIHKDSSEEIRRLVGGLKKIYDIHIPELHSLFRKLDSNPNFKYMEVYESRLRILADVGKGLVPAQLTRFYAYLNKFPRDYRAIDWEEKQYILESSFLLHDLHNTLMNILEETPGLSPDLKDNLKNIIDYINSMIEDFRLKDLKRKM